MNTPSASADLRAIDRLWSRMPKDLDLKKRVYVAHPAEIDRRNDGPPLAPLFARIRAYGPPPGLQAKFEAPRRSGVGGEGEHRRVGLMLMLLPLVGLLALWTSPRYARDTKLALTAVTAFWMGSVVAAIASVVLSLV